MQRNCARIRTKGNEVQGADHGRGRNKKRVGKTVKSVASRYQKKISGMGKGKARARGVKKGRAANRTILQRWGPPSRLEKKKAEEGNIRRG